MNESNILDSVNKEVYARADVIESYENLDMMLKPEKLLLEQLAPSIRDQKILDIGIGGGRTTKYLLQLSKDYTGIDYSPEFVAVAQAKYTEARILCCDARDLTIFADQSFAFVLFSFNSIDYIPHEDRKKALREIYRVLKPGGVFMFSTHNRDHEGFNQLPWQGAFQFNLNYVKNCLYCLYYLPKHLRMKKHENFQPEYAVINDNAHGFSLLAYYISIPEQTKQLAEIGFSSVEAYDMEGRLVTSDTTFPWTYYLAKK